VSGLLLDEMYPPALAQKLRADGHDVVAVLDVEVGLASRSDADVLAWAARKERCVVTENVRDFVRLAVEMPHAGIVLVSSQRFPRTVAGLARLATSLSELLAEGRVPSAGGGIWAGH
jgi:hypothetical protein